LVTDFGGLLAALNDAGVRYVVIGGLAAAAHGSIRATRDVDVVYERSDENLDRLVAALARLAPYLRGAPAGLPFRFDRATLRSGLNFTLTTALGEIDLLGEVVGGGRYADLAERSAELDVAGVRCRCVDLPTLIATKRAAGRPRDFDAIAELEALREEIDRRAE
jgi:predicted nucleotidyltransferase